MGDLQHDFAAEKSAAIMWCNHSNKKQFPTLARFVNILDLFSNFQFICFIASCLGTNLASF